MAPPKEKWHQRMAPSEEKWHQQRRSNLRASKLTDLKCRKAAPKAKPYRLADSGGLHLLVTPFGGKVWRWKYRFDVKQKQMAFGKYPDVPLSEARLRHAQARALLASGVDPMAARKESNEQKRVGHIEPEKPTGLTFEDLTRKFFEWWQKGKEVKYAKNVETRLEGDIIARVGARRPAEITRLEVVKLIQDVDARGARDIAKRNLQFVRRIFDSG